MALTFFRRRQFPPGLAAVSEGFETVLTEVEAAKEILVSSVPRARFPGMPLDEALEGFRSKLQDARASMAGWLVDETAKVWLACEQALELAIERAETLLAQIDPGEPLGFQVLLERVQDCVDQLEPFSDAEERFRELRR